MEFLPGQCEVYVLLENLQCARKVFRLVLSIPPEENHLVGLRQRQHAIEKLFNRDMKARGSEHERTFKNNQKDGKVFLVIKWALLQMFSKLQRCSAQCCFEYNDIAVRIMIENQLKD